MKQFKNLEKCLNFYTKENFRKNEWCQIINIDYVELMKKVDFKNFFLRDKNDVRLLDIGCGTGIFTSMLLPQIIQGPSIIYDYLDPSDYCLIELKKSLKKPFVIGNSFHMTAEEFSKNPVCQNTYDIIWSIHSLYCVEKSALQLTLNSIINLLSDHHSRLLIYQATPCSSYCLIQEMYSKYIAEKNEHSFLWSSETQKVLDSLSVNYNKNTLNFTHTVNNKLLKSYLDQCIFSKISLEQWYSTNEMQYWFESHKKDDKFLFPQQIDLFEIEGKPR
jgi:SAM-dependent methyltransferase